MQDCKSINISEEEYIQFNAYKQMKKLNETRAKIAMLEYDALTIAQDRETLKGVFLEASRLNLGGVCVLPSQVRYCLQVFGQKPQFSLVACVGYPHGGDLTSVKVKAVRYCVRDGASAVEVTAPVYAIKGNNWTLVRKEFKRIKKAAKHAAARIVLECGTFTELQYKKCAAIAAEVGITCLRTASGAYESGNCEEQIEALVSVVEDKCAVKASGVATSAQFLALLNCGAKKVSSTNALQIAEQLLAQASQPIENVEQ